MSTRTTWAVQRVPEVSGGVRLLATALSAILALIVAGIVLRLCGLPPLALGARVLHASFGTRFGIEDLLLLASPLAACGLSVAVMLRVGLWNIGAEGQFFVGATGAAAVGLFLPVGGTGTTLALMALAAAAGGALWIALPAAARLVLGTSEIITTLLLNFVARLLVDFLATGSWRDARSSVTAQTPRIHAAFAKLPRDWHLGGLHWGIALVIALAAVVALLFRYTSWGFELRVCGANREAARYAGMPVGRRLAEAMLLGGALAGLGGMIELAGTVHRLQGGLSNSYGYVGIIVAVLAAAAPVGVLFSALLMAVVLNAGTVLQTQGLPASAAVALVGLILLFVAMGERLSHYRIAVIRPRATPAGTGSAAAASGAAE
ncbi:ABC transporter permease [Rhizosaccharibacter radicis]|uniref:ABC transporter permease n=1 Tax=Rhizosaccharibacter radicis TaxID=2782605 RepID=A0ABT1VTR1_9PROT|nr:ABC transporter permease [Acetobacteraceae bacterium KSS12]